VIVEKFRIATADEIFILVSRIREVVFESMILDLMSRKCTFLHGLTVQKRIVILTIPLAYSMMVGRVLIDAIM